MKEYKIITTTVMVDSHFPPGWDAVIVHCCCFDGCNEVKVFLVLISPQGLQTGFWSLGIC